MKASKTLFSLYLLFLLVFTIFIGVKPYYNIDMLPYMAIIQKMDGEQSIKDIHHTTYSEIKANTSNQEYEVLISGTGYRKALFLDEASFDEQLSFYVIKPLYLLSAFAFYKMGAGLSFSTVLPSLISFFVIGLIAFKWTNKILPYPWIAFWACLLLMTSQPFISLGKSAAPDGLASALLLGGCYLFIERKSLWGSVLLFTLSILTRPDYVILVFLIFLLVLLGKWSRKVPVWQLLIFFALFFSAYYIPKILLGGVAWSTLFHHAFIERVLYPLTSPQSISVNDYIAVIADNLIHRTYFAVTSLLLILFFAGFTCWDKVKNINLNLQEWSFRQAFMLILIFAIAVRFFLFPTFLDRFMAPFIFLSAIIFIKEVYERLMASGSIEMPPVEENSKGFAA